MKKQILVTMLVLSFILTACGKKEKTVNVTVKRENDSRKVETRDTDNVNKEEPEIEDDQFIVKKELLSNEYKDESTGLLITVPESWQGKVELLEVDNQEFRILSFSYKDSNDYNIMLMMINLFPNSTTNIYEIERMPNNLIIAQDNKYIYTVSQGLGVPYEYGKEDFKVYTSMITEIDNVIENISFVDKEITLNKKIKEINKDKNYIIEVSYPVLENNEEFNEISFKQIETIIQDFKDDLPEPIVIEKPEVEPKSESEVIEERIEERVEERVDNGPINSLFINYSLTHLDDEIISIKYSVSTYLIGSSHSNNYSLPLNYNFEQNKNISLSNLFSVSKEEYLSRISELAIVKLTQELKEIGANIDSEMFEEGTMSKKENYENFNIKENGIQFNFDANSIGPYALGAFTVFVEYDSINDVIRK